MSHLLLDIYMIEYIDGLAQDCSNSIANAMELLQSCIKPLICLLHSAHSWLVFNIHIINEQQKLFALCNLVLSSGPLY